MSGRAPPNHTHPAQRTRHRIGRPRALALALALGALVAMAGQAEAVRIDPGAVFLTRAETVEWKTSITLDVSSVVVNQTHLILGGYQLDAYAQHPSATTTVTIQQWGDDSKTFNITTTAPTLLDFTMSNPGFSYASLVNGVASATCLATTAVCRWQLPNTTAWTFIVAFPTSQSISAGGGTTTTTSTASAGPAAGGTGGDPFATRPQEPAPFVLPGPVNPVILLGQMGPLHYVGAAVSLTLIFSYFPFSRPIVPVRLPSNTWTLAAGVLLLVVLYFTLIATYAEPSAP